MEFNDKVPIYYQIEQYISREIIIGHLNAGQQLPSIRELALQLTVNVNTVQRAITALIAAGIVVPQRGKGNFVTMDTEAIVKLREQVVKTQLATLYDHLVALKITPTEMERYLKQYIREQENND